MKTEDSVRLFPCRDRKSEFPGLEGVSFDLMDNLPLDDALCIYGGPNCTFTGMLEFVRRQRDHQFVAGGLLFSIPERLTENTRPSAPISEDRIIVIGRRDSKSSIVQAYTTILRPFQLATWMMLLGILMFFVFARVLIAAYFSDPRTPRNIARHVFDEHDLHSNETQRLLNKGAVASLMISVAAFFAIVILFYEIAVVNFVFSKKKHALQKSLSSLTEEEMKQYVIPKAEATENIWRKYVKAENKYVNHTPPWHWCSYHPEWYVYLELQCTSDLRIWLTIFLSTTFFVACLFCVCFLKCSVTKALNKSHPAKLSMTYEVRILALMLLGNLLRTDIGTDGASLIYNRLHCPSEFCSILPQR